MLYTTFRLLKEAKPLPACKESYRELVGHLGGTRKYGKDTPIPLTYILELLGLNDALWCLRATTTNSERLSRLLAGDYAERVLYIYEEAFPDDNRPLYAVEVSRRFANGEATKEELAAAGADAFAAWAAARADAGDARADAFAAWAAAWAAGAAAGDAVVPAWAAASAAASAAWAAASDDAGAAGADAFAAGDAEREWQKQHFIEMLERS